MTSTGYRRNSLRGGGEREDGGGRLIVETIKGRRGRKGEKKGEEVVMRVVGEGGGKISAWVSRERLRDRGDGRLNIGFSDARGTYLMSYIFRWPAQFKFPFTENSLGGEGRKLCSRVALLAF